METIGFGHTKALMSEKGQHRTKVTIED